MSPGPSERDPLIPRRGSQTGDGEQQPKRVETRRPGPLEISKSTRYGILAGLWSANFLAALNQTLVPTMLPQISSEFHQFNQAGWLGTSYLLSTCTFTPLYGRLCNVLGRRGASQVALLFACSGVLMSGLSSSMEMLIASRFLAGIGGGGLFTIASISVSDMYSLRKRGLTQGLSSVFGSLGMGLGGPFGGLMTDWLGWRAAFLVQVPFFFVSFALTSHFLCYATPGKGKSAKEVLKRIDYWGSLSLLLAVGSILIFLSSRYNQGLPWSDITVVASIITAVVSGVAFMLIEILITPEPVMAPFLLVQKIPMLVSASNFLVALCNFSITYFFPMWFQTVMKTNASIAGLHLMPNSVALSCGSIFAGYVMQRTGRYKTINTVFGWFPFIGAMLIATMREDSNPFRTWLSIVPLGFGNAIVLQTMLIALLANLPQSHIAVGTGFGQLFRGIGQVGGVAISSAVFQSRLDSELRARIRTPNAEELIKNIRQSTTFVDSLPPELQQEARISYTLGIKSVFYFAAVSTLLAYLVRIPIPDTQLEHQPKSQATQPKPQSIQQNGSGTHEETDIREYAVDDEDEDDEEEDRLNATPKGLPRRRLSTFESIDGGMDLESSRIGGSARQPGIPPTPSHAHS